MRYNFNFDIGTVIFFSLTIYFYLRQKRIKDRTDVLFRIMLAFSMISTIFDFFSATLESVCALHPLWLLYAVNIIFIAAMQACLPVFFFYSAASAGRYYGLTAKSRAVIMLPFAVTLTLLLLSPLGRFGVFYIDENHAYQTGTMHMALYVNTALYMTASLLMLFRHIRTVGRSTRNVILVFSVLVFVSIVLQLIYPKQLLTASGTALALTSVFYALQSPIDRINPFTGAFSRTMLPFVLRELKQKRQPHTMLLFTLFSFEELSRVYGANFGDSILRELSEKLQKSFPDGTVIYMDTCEFVVVVDRLLSESDAVWEREHILGELHGEVEDMPMEISVAVLPCKNDDSMEDTLVIMDCMFREKRLTRGGGVFYADAEYRAECSKNTLFESSLESVLRDGTPGLILFPVFDAELHFRGADAMLGVTHSAAEGVSEKQLFASTERAGLMWSYYSLLFRLLSAEQERLCGKTVAIELSSSVCIQSDAAERLAALAEDAGIKPQSISFNIREEELASALPAVYETVGRLKDFGFRLIITDFAVGYTDISRLSGSFISGVKLHESLLKNAGGKKREALLSGVISVIKDMGITPICAGVDTAEDFAHAVAAGVEHLQGNFADGSPAQVKP